MHEEFKRIMAFFSMNSDDKPGRLEDVFHDSIEFFEKFKDILQHGTPEEKAEIMKEMTELQQKLQEETERMCHDTGLSEEQLRNFAQNRDNFSDEEWHSIQQAKAKLERQAEELSDILPGGNNTKKKSSSDKKPKEGGHRPKKQQWTKS